MTLFKQIHHESRVFDIYHLHKVKHIILPMTKSNKICNTKCFLDNSTINYYFESKTEILVFGNTFNDSNERVFWVNSQYAKCQTLMLCTNNG